MKMLHFHEVARLRETGMAGKNVVASTITMFRHRDVKREKCSSLKSKREVNFIQEKLSGRKKVFVKSVI